METTPELTLADLKIETFDLPHKDFNPLKATKEQLLKHGFFNVPKPDNEGERYKFWKRIFSNNPAYATPSFELNKNINIGRKEKSPDSGSSIHPDYSVSLYAGFQIQPPINEFNNVLTGAYTIPNVGYPSRFGGEYEFEAGVSIQVLSQDNSNYVMIGTVVQVNTAPVLFIAYIYQSLRFGRYWYTPVYGNIFGIPINSGDYFNFEISYNNTANQFQILITNITQNTVASPMLFTNCKFLVDCILAQWTVQRLSDTERGINTVAPNFGSIYIDNAYMNGVAAGTGSYFDMNNDFGNIVGVASKVNNSNNGSVIRIASDTANLI